jgi:serine/threonine protein kinase
MLSNLLRKLMTLMRPDGLPSLRCGRRVWHVTSAGAELFRSTGLDLEGWIGGGMAEVVKTNPARTVYRVTTGHGTIFIKHCKIPTSRVWWREIIRLPKARLEFENALALRERNISAVEPLAWGAPDSLWPQESFLITRGHTRAMPFLHYLENVLPGLPPEEHRAICRQLACELGRFLALLHDAGVVHPDPHPGNLLVELPSCRIPRFALIDLHAIHIGKPLNWIESRNNLALFNRWFQLRASRSDRARFWHAYRRSRKQLPLSSSDAVRAEAKELERETDASNFRLWNSRQARCLGSNRYFRKVKRGVIHGLAVRDLPDAFLHELLANPDAAFEHHQTQTLKSSPTSSVIEMMMPGPAGPVPVVLKQVNLRSGITPIKNLLRQSQVLRSWANGHALRARWLPTPRPLAVFHRYRKGLPAEGYLLTEKVPGAVVLDVAVAASRGRVLDGTPPVATADLTAISQKLARILRTMHDRGVSHRDLKAANILLADGHEPMLIDLVGVRTGVRLGNSHRAKELARLNASFLHSPHVTRGDRLRFLLAYLAAGPSLGVDWKMWWKMVSRATVAKAAKNRRRGRTLG